MIARTREGRTPDLDLCPFHDVRGDLMLELGGETSAYRMLASVHSASVEGINAHPVFVEVDVARGGPLRICAVAHILHAMLVTYDPDVDALYFELLALGSRKLTQRAVASGVILDIGSKGEIAGLEILAASRFGTPRDLARFARPSSGMRLSEAAAYSGLKAASLRNQILNGRLRATKNGRDWLVDLNDLESYLAGRDSRGRRSATEKPRRRVRRAAA